MLDLLLRYPDGRPVAEELEDEAVAFAKTSGREEPTPEVLAHDGDGNAMDQGWGVLVPRGRRDLFEAIAELRRWRQELIESVARGRPPCVLDWELGPQMDARTFLDREYLSLPRPKRPAYLLILGDFDGISLEFQQGLALFAYVGRLCLPSHDDYVAYARKVVASERDRVDQARPRLFLLSTSNPARPDRALDQGHRDLITPLFEDFVDPELGLGLDEGLVDMLGPRAPDQAVRAWAGAGPRLAATAPSVLLSLGHGSGDPGWTTQEQRGRQGRLNLGNGHELESDAIARGPFLPRGAWLHYACFGGGTPEHSAFEPWLRRLVGAGLWRGGAEVLGTLARESAFVARQPQLALANPEGPLIVIAHADLAFSYSFRRAKGQHLEHRGSRSFAAEARPNHGPLRDVVQSLVGGSRSGLALSRLRPAMHDADQALLRQWHEREHGHSVLIRMLIDKSKASSAVAPDDPAQAVLAAVRAVVAELGAAGVTLERVAEQAGRSPRALLAELGRAIDRAALAHLGHNWMARHDLGGWFLLGDPAARVPMTDHHPRSLDTATIEEAMRATSASAASSPTETGARVAARDEGTGLILELHRLERPEDPFAFQLEPQDYIVREAGGTIARARLPWSTSLLEDLTLIAAPNPPQASQRRVGDLLATFVEGAPVLVEALRETAAGRESERRLTIRTTAAELSVLPWELLTVPGTGTRLGALPSVYLAYEWAGSKTRLESTALPPGSRMLFVWSSRGGAVAAEKHRDALDEALPEGVVTLDEFGGSNPPAVGAMLRRARDEGRPYRVVHLLTHGHAGDDGAVTLAWNEQGPLSGPGLAEAMREHADTVRLVVLSACHGGAPPQVDTRLGSMAWHLHRAGIAAVVASRAPLTIRASLVVTRTLHRALLHDGEALHTAWGQCREAVRASAEEGHDWANILLMARWSDEGRGRDALADLRRHGWIDRPISADDLASMMTALRPGPEPGSQNELEIARVALVTLAFIRALRAAERESEPSFVELRLALTRLREAARRDARPPSTDELSAELSRLCGRLGSPLASSTYAALRAALTDPPQFELGPESAFEHQLITHYEQALTSEVGAPVRASTDALTGHLRRLITTVMVTRASEATPDLSEPRVRREGGELVELYEHLYALLARPLGGRAIILSGDHGVGKSVVVREVAARLARRWLTAEDGRLAQWLPIHLDCATDFGPQALVESGGGRFFEDAQRRAWRRRLMEIVPELPASDEVLAGPEPEQRTLWIFDGLDGWSTNAEILRILFHQLRDHATDRHRYLLTSRPFAVPSLDERAGATVLDLEGAVTGEGRGPGYLRLLGAGALAPALRQRLDEVGSDASTPVLVWLEHVCRELSRAQDHDLVVRASRELRLVLRDKRQIGVDASEEDALLELMGWVMWRARCIGDGPTNHQVDELLRAELDVHHDQSRERIRGAVLLCLQWRLHEGRTRVLFDSEHLAAFLVARFWASRLSRIVSDQLDGDGQLERSLLGGRLRHEPDLRFDYLVAMITGRGAGHSLGPLFDWTTARRRTLAGWTQSTFEDESLHTKGGYRLDQRAWLREAVLSLRCSLTDIGPYLVREDHLRSLLAWFWVRQVPPLVTLSHCDMREFRLEAASLERADLTEVDLSGAELARADLSYTQLTGARLVGTRMLSANLEWSELLGSDLKDANLERADLSGAQMAGACLASAELSGARLHHADLSDSDLTNASLIRVDATGAVFHGANLSNAEMSEAQLCSADLSHADLSDANLRRVDLEGAMLVGARLRGADLTRANLADADLSDTDLDQVVLTGATWSNSTIWPGDGAVPPQPPDAPAPEPEPEPAPEPAPPRAAAPEILEPTDAPRGHFNGIDASSGSHLFPSMTAAQIAAVAQGRAIETRASDTDHLTELAARAGGGASFGTKAGIDPTKLEEAGWAVIFPAVKRDSERARRQDEIYEALSPLLLHRKRQATAIDDRYYREYRGARGYRPGESKQDFLARLGTGPGPADPAKVPYFLLIVGSPREIPFRVQYQIDVQYAVGRIHFDTLQEYADYARSVVEAETRGSPRPRELAFVGVANPDDPATELSRSNLVVPLADILETRVPPGWTITRILDEQANKATVGELFGGPRTPAFVFTASHGIGFPSGDPRQRRHQGALLLQDWPGPQRGEGPIGEDLYLSGDDIGRDADVHGLITFNFACYSAGTPEHDGFSRGGSRRRLADEAFIAGLPRRLLAHPRGGALATIGHVDRSWGCSFVWRTGPRRGRTADLAVFESMLESLLHGAPVGVAVEYLNERYAELASDLNDRLEDLEYSPVAPEVLARLWTASNDARGYAITGDPAVRLSVGEAGESEALPLADPHEDVVGLAGVGAAEILSARPAHVDVARTIDSDGTGALGLGGADQRAVDQLNDQTAPVEADSAVLDFVNHETSDHASLGGLAVTICSGESSTDRPSEQW